MSEFHLNLFDCIGKSSASKTLSDYFHIPADKIFEFLGCHYQESAVVSEFIKYFHIDLNYQYYDNIYIACRHATTSFDNLQHIKEFGMLSLCKLLSTKSPLSEFLLENRIHIDVESKMLYYNEEPHDILGLQEKCTKCEKGRSDCVYENPVFSCDYRNKIHTLYSKLYDYKGEVEVFVNGSSDDIYEYAQKTSIRYSPEILYTLDKIVSYFWQKQSSLINCWANKKNNKFYILECDANLDEFDVIPRDLDICSQCYVEEFLSTYSYSYNDYIKNKASKMFYYNLFVTERLIENFIFGIHGLIAKIGALKADAKIDYSKIHVIEEHNII